MATKRKVKVLAIILVIFSLILALLIPLRGKIASFLREKRAVSYDLSISNQKDLPKPDKHENTPIETSSGEVSLHSNQTFFETDQKPTFTINLNENIFKSGFRSFESVFSGEKQVFQHDTNVRVLDPNGEQVKSLKVDRKKDSIEVQFSSSEELSPGKYTIIVDFDGSAIKQNFYWGVLAINSNKAVYYQGETAILNIAVLNDAGKTVCDAQVRLKITDPSGSVKLLNTNDGSIKVNSEVCQSLDPTFLADYEATYLTTQNGNYELELSAITEDGVWAIRSSFEVATNQQYEIERQSTTRIYPKNIYPMKIAIKPSTDFSGEVSEVIPHNFTIANPTDQDLSNFFTESEKEDFLREENQAFNIRNDMDSKKIVWQVDWKAGETYSLIYFYDAPDVSPDFYTLGPLQIGDFMSEKEWQIAVDAVQKAVGFFSPPLTWTAAANADLALVQPDPRDDDLMIATIAIRPAASTINTPSGWTLLDSRTGTDGGAEGGDAGSVGFYTFYKVADGTEGSSTVTFTENGTTSVWTGNISKVRSSTGTYDLSVGGYSINGDSTNWNGTLDNDIGLTQGDVVMIMATQNGNISSNTSGWDISADGITHKSNSKEHGQYTNSTGNDVEVGLATAQIWEGTSTSTPTVTVTQSTAASGTVSAVRIRQGSGTNRSDSFVKSAGPQIGGTSSISVLFPEHEIGDLLLMFVASRATADNTPNTPLGWTSLGSYNGGTGTFGVNSGNSRISVFYAHVGARIDTTQPVSVTSGNVVTAQIVSVHHDGDVNWVLDQDGGTDVSAGTDWSVTGSGIDLDSASGGDLLLIGSSINSAAYTYSNPTISASGIGFGEDTITGQFISTTGNDTSLVVSTTRVISGSALGVAPAFGMTSSGSTTNAPAGSSMFVKVNTTPTDISEKHVGFFSPKNLWTSAGNGNLDLVQPDPRDGDLMIATLAIRPAASTINTPSGWTLLDSRTGTDGGAEALDAGSVGLYTFYKEADGTEGSSTVTFTENGTTSGWIGNIAQVRSATGTYDLSVGGYSINGDATNWNGTLDTDIGLTQGDIVLIAAAQNGDQGVPTGFDFNATGITQQGTVNKHGDYSTTAGNDARVSLATAQIWEGTNTATPTVSVTQSIGVSGTVAAIRIRQGSGTNRSDSWVRSAGAQTFGATSFSAPYPEHEIGDALLLLITSRSTADVTPTTPPGWTNLGSYNGGAGVFSSDSGNARITAFYLPANVRMTGSLPVTVTGGSSVVAQVLAVHHDGEVSWVFDIDGGADNTAGTDWSVTGSGIDLDSASGGDLVLIGSAINTDLAYLYTNPTFSASGIGVGEVTMAGQFATANGNDSALAVSTARITSGSELGVVPTFAMTSSGTAGGNNPAGSSILIKINATTESITLEGTADSNEGATVKFAINDVLQAQSGTISSGVWTISGVAQPSADDIITVWVDGVADSNESTAITKYDTGDLTSMVLNTNTLSLGSNQNTSLSLADLDLYDCTQDEDIMQQATSSHLKVEGDVCADSSTNSYSSEKISILASNTLSLGTSETLTTYDLDNLGTLTSTGNTSYNVSHDWSNTGTFTPDTSTLTLNGAGGTTQTIAGTNAFYNLSATGSSARTIKFPSSTTTTITNSLTLTGAASELLTLDPSTTDTVWTIDPPPSNVSVDYANVNFSTATECISATNSTGANNTLWFLEGESCTPSTNQTENSFQRKTWHDGTNFWRSFYDSSDSFIKFEYSSDGTSWTENTSARIEAIDADYSVQADSTDLYIAYKTGVVQDTDNLSTSNLVGYWKMNEVNWTSNLAADSSGNGFTGTAAGDATTTTGKFGNGGIFDGTADRVTITDSAAQRPGCGSWSISAWVNPLNADQSSVIINKVNLSSSMAYHMSISGSTDGSVTGKKLLVSLQEATSGDRRMAITSNGFVDGNWHHVASVWDSVADSVTLYVDGIAQSSATDFSGAWPCVANTQDIMIGSYNIGVYDYNGLMDDVRIYDRTLSTKEVADLGQPGYDIEVRKAVSYTTTSFAWSNESIALNGTSSSDYYQYPVIAKDSNSKIWVGGARNNSGTYSFDVVRSTNASDIAAWDGLTSLASSTDSNNHGLILPMTSGNMYSPFVIGTEIKGCLYDEVGDDRWEDSAGNICDATTQEEDDTISLVQSATDDVGGVDATQVTVTLASTPVAGNLLVAHVQISNSRVITPPSGWSTAIDQDGRGHILYKVAGESEPTGHTFAFESGTAARINGHLLEYSGLHDVQGEVLDEVVGNLNESTGFASTGTTATTSFTNSLASASVGANGSRTFSDWTNSFTGGITTLPRSATASRILTATGTYETTATLSSAVTQEIGVMAVFRGGTTTIPAQVDDISATTGSISSSLSAVSDDNGHVHLLYIDDTGQAVYRKYTTSWQTPVVLDSNAGNSYPTISLDTNNGDLYAFWTRSNDILYKIGASPYNSGDFDVSATSWQTTGTNTSASSTLIDGGNSIFVQWHNGSDIAFDTILLTSSFISVTITTDGIVEYGTLGSGQSVDTISLTDTQTASNDGDLDIDLNIKTSTPVGWALGASAAEDTFVHEFSTNSGTDWIKFTTADVYQTLITNLTSSSSQNFDLRFTAPNPSTSSDEKTLTITIQAVEH